MRYHVKNSQGEELVVPSLDDLHDLYAHGFLGDDDLVRSDTSERWIRVGSMRALQGVRDRRADHIDANGTQDAVDHRELWRESQRDRFGGAVLLVAGKLLDAPLRPPIGIVRHRDAYRTALEDQTSQAEEEPANRGCPQGVSILDAPLSTIERPEDQA